MAHFGNVEAQKDFCALRLAKVGSCKELLVLNLDVVSESGILRNEWLRIT